MFDGWVVYMFDGCAMESNETSEINGMLQLQLLELIWQKYNFKEVMEFIIKL